MWVVEMETGNGWWTPICYCAKYGEALEVVSQPHIIADGRAVRFRKFGREQ